MKNKIMIKTRFAPSPTGFLHIGGLRTALFAYLFAKKNKGAFILRIEDTDRERYVENGIKNILDSLYWAGIKPDEGVILDNNKISQKGKNGPYIQSERLKIYHKYIKELIDSNHAYYCFCNKERLENLRKEQETNKLPTKYDGLCKKLSREQIEEKLKNKIPYVIRLKMPKEGITSFNDLIRGKVDFKNDLIDDQVLIKSDGYPTYHFAVVIDDHLMEITHVIRGEEWISSTPKHIELYKAFGWKAPEFAHLSLLVNEQKQKLSKRHGDVSVKDFKNIGYLPEAIINFVAFLGWNPGDDREIFSFKDLEKEFDLNKVGRAPAVFNMEKLSWYNSFYIKNKSIEDLTAACVDFFKNSKNENLFKDKEQSTKLVALEKERMQKLSELPEAVEYIWKLNYNPNLLIWKKSSHELTKEKLKLLKTFLSELPEKQWKIKSEKYPYLEKEILDWIKNNNFGIGDILWPMRVALSGKKDSHGPFELAGFLGKTETLERIKKAIDLL
jgi:glutamyl-tRNA synthetase